MLFRPTFSERKNRLNECCGVEVASRSALAGRQVRVDRVATGIHHIVRADQDATAATSDIDRIALVVDRIGEAGLGLKQPGNLPAARDRGAYSVAEHLLALAER